LKRFTSALRPATGILFFLVPYRVLDVAACYLSRHYMTPRAWRLPDPHFDVFGQVLVVARRAPATMAANPSEQTYRRWAADPHAMDPLPEVVDDPLVIDVPDDDFKLRLQRFDLGAALASADSTQHLPELRDQGARDLLGGRFHTAMPPRAAHIALALASGMFNGLRLAPNDSARHPPLLVKGVFERKLLEIAERRNADGELTGTVEVERPSLRLCALRLDSYEYLELAPGTTPTGSHDLTEWCAADLITNYDTSLALLLKKQFPPIHDPRRPDHAITLPPLPRTPFTIQRHAIQAALKLLALGETPFLVADVGTGKSTMGLYIAAALSPAYRDTTLRELERLGFDLSSGTGRRRRSRLRPVRRTLILCPPHLQESWVDQTRAVLPQARIQILRRLADLDAEADVYILSRETAKLGHGYRGLEGACPSCGGPILTPAKKNAAKRLTCPATRRTPTDALARLAKALAEHLAPSVPEHPLVLSSGVEPVYLARCARRSEPRPLRPDAFGFLRRRFLETIVVLLEDGATNQLYSALQALERLAQATGKAAETAEALRELALSDGSHHGRYCREAAKRLRSSHGLTPGKLLLAALEQLHLHAQWHDAPPCGERLYQAIPQPRRVAFARRIVRRYRRKFGLILMDEAHEYSHTRSAQTHAAHRLVGLPGVRTVVLTGTLMGGYASSLFSLFWALSPRFRGEFSRGEKSRFTQRYGYQKLLVAPRKTSDADATYGAHSDRRLSSSRRSL
ncbi:MAG: DEAD/DEAH box helicase, partial [Mesoflavibacter sp.]|nr:DEAD/DEAH box helicase [Mesoflavibacter sp.]